MSSAHPQSALVDMKSCLLAPQIHQMILLLVKHTTFYRLECRIVHEDHSAPKRLLNAITEKLGQCHTHHTKLNYN